MGVYPSVKGILKNKRTSNERPSIELGAVDHVSPDIEPNTVRGGYGVVDKDKPNRNASNKDKLIKKIQGQGLIPHPMPESDDDAVMPSSSTSLEEAERMLNRRLAQQRLEMQEEVNSMKRRLAQQQQEMEAKQREMDQQIVLLRSQLQIHRDVPPT
ncbi:hypothetical protein FH972_027022 [Carpinus fangiana]|uniref:Uncharacterized protein n=1 Tax=Carpinus fangiana TaxID=176857 RepID=A0A5N6L5S9_9ROSI|nr:hypothetical protein FH972_027022 [Carpinus fangiana]